MSAEVPQGYFPDYPIEWAPVKAQTHSTEILLFRSGKEQRRSNFPVAGYSGYQLSVISNSIAERQEIFEFLQAKQGALIPFYFFRPDYAYSKIYSLGTITADTQIIVPFKGGTYTGVTVAGVAKTVTVTRDAGPGGEDQLNFSGSQTGAVAATVINGRQRIIVRSENDSFVETWPIVGTSNLSTFPNIVLLQR